MFRSEAGAFPTAHPDLHSGFDAREFQARVDAARGDVTAAVVGWLVETGRLQPAAALTHLEIRGWKIPD
ncbi:hypothetical protein [Streptomyces sp. MI02-7b]|uniref:hypothetical protein n=1 Tax=Streptomyces sp. MI02-7b TaxID=462941 RepID=UPI0029BE2A86|nr:hypothetical protein [Streptomyces sp. MI02-7b]MDX3073977.1 hypothetical protein [Streptomyces sp. MI02-7b]